MRRTETVLNAMGSPAATVIGFSMVAALALYGMLAYAVPVALPFGFARIARRRSVVGARLQVDADALELTEALLQKLAEGAPLANALERSLPQKYAFRDDAVRALQCYTRSGDAKVFGSVSAFGSKRLKELFSAIAASLESGHDASVPLERLRDDFRQADSYRLRGIGNSSNYSAVMRLGTSVFFPMFAGVSVNIMGFAHSALGGPAQAGASLLGIFAVYAVAANYAGTSAATGFSGRIADSALFGGIAILVMESAAALSGAVG